MGAAQNLTPFHPEFASGGPTDWNKAHNSYNRSNRILRALTTKSLEFFQFPVGSWSPVTLSSHYAEFSMDFNSALCCWVPAGLWQSFSEVVPALIWLSEHKWLWLLYGFWHSTKSSRRKFVHSVPFIVPSILTSLSVPSAEKPLHSMTLPPPCFAVGVLLDG